MLRATIHLMLHVAVPGLIAKWGYGTRWKPAWLVMMLTMMVDLDHLLADPLYAPNRCSIGFHPLHTFWPMVLYGVLLWFPKTRLVGIGLLVHMLLDGIDCVWMG